MNGVDDSTEASQMANNFFGGMFGSVDPNSDVGRLLARYRQATTPSGIATMPRFNFTGTGTAAGTTQGATAGSTEDAQGQPYVPSPVTPMPTPDLYNSGPITATNALPGPLMQPSSIGTPFFQQNAGGLTPGTIPVAGPGPISLETGAVPLMQLATNPNLTPTILGGQETLGYYTDRFGNRILSPGAVGAFAEGGEVDAEAIRALMKRRRVDTNFSTAKEMLDSLSTDGGERVDIKVSPKKRTLRRASKRPISGETPSGSARGMVEEFDELSTARGPRSMETQKTGQQRIDFTTETLSSPELMRASIGRAGDLMTRRFKDGGEVAEQDPLLAAQAFLRKAAVRRMAEGGEVTDPKKFLDLLGQGALEAYEQGTPVERAAYDVYGLTPGLERSALLPAAKTAEGTVQPAAPSALYELAKASLVPGTAAKGQEVTPEEALSAASSLVGAGGASAPAMQAGDFAMNAWHGSPSRNIQRFSTDFVGSGQGNKTYGWGLYFSSKKELADYYRDTLSQKARLLERGRNDYVVADPSGKPIAEGLLYGQAVKAKEAYDKQVGQLYKVDIPEEKEMLDWDRPLAEQPEDVRSALLNIASSLDPSNKENKYFLDAVMRNKRGQNLYQGLQAAFNQSSQLKSVGDKETSQLLLEKGVRGVRYLDAESRREGSGRPNYVVFSGEDVSILENEYKNGGLVDKNTAFIRKMAKGGPVDVLSEAQAFLQRAQGRK